MNRTGLIVLLCLFLGVKLGAQSLPVFIPEALGFNTLKLKNIDRLMNEAILDKGLPGGVVAVVKKDKIAYLKAFGNQQLYPVVTAMDVHTVFDLASLTKPLATAISVFVLLERGELSLQDPVSFFIPEFENSSEDIHKKPIRVIDLLMHTSGLPPYAPVSSLINDRVDLDYPNRLKEYINQQSVISEPSEEMVYSCLNYITLQYIIEKIAGESLDTFADKNIYKPLKLTSTQFVPSGNLLRRCASTENITETQWLQGEVHDPLARVMNCGVSGNAGLFSTATDVATLASLFLNEGQASGQQILSPASIRVMSSLPLGLEQIGRTPGWDFDTAYSWNQGDLLHDNSFGHTGFTGTSIVIDPQAELAIIILTNKLHSKEPIDMGSLFMRIVNVVASSDGTATNQNYLMHYAMRMDQFKKESPISSNDIVILGDSQVENGGDWAKRLGRKHVVNRGIVGDNTEGVLGRLDDIIAGSPKELILAIGINDISQGLNHYTLVENINKILQRFKAESPKTKLYLQSVLPINERKSFYSLLKGESQTIVKVNQELEKLAAKENVVFINTYPHFLEEGSDQLRPDWTNDGLHLKEDGYVMWTSLLTDKLR